MEICTSDVHATHELAANLDRLGDEIAELSAHLDAGDRYQVVVHVDAPVLADTDGPG